MKGVTKTKDKYYQVNEDNKKNLLSMGKRQKAIENSISLLASSIGSLDKKLSKLENITEKNNEEIKLIVANQYSHHEKLTLRAIISGRAWLVNNDGVTLTVTKNTNIPGYGHVVNIDDKKEQVKMSSGYIFK
ncbi:hypothetical protein [Piscirickettsia litoralis]|uniref:Uncharacterized protein n=1 Tax=Piscirickettsia litoralis TaxID=1891921 RepID=A0ABX2ZYK8_9GAMM|nr:hypothetical protein [Piscirickettsia litoralis]ODN41469.1 hypothetical protein BGC07_15220 [Piscirickettsia litoralis]